MEKKSNIGLKVGLIISILCVLGLLGYIIYNKIQEKENRNAPIIDIEKKTALKKTDIEDLLKESETRSDHDEIMKKIEERNEAKTNKDFAKADSIRDELLSKGIMLVDTREGTTYKEV